MKNSLIVFHTDCDQSPAFRYIMSTSSFFSRSLACSLVSRDDRECKFVAIKHQKQIFYQFMVAPMGFLCCFLSSQLDILFFGFRLNNFIHSAVDLREEFDGNRIEQAGRQEGKKRDCITFV